MRLLLVEDDRIVRIPVRDALEETGFEVADFADAESALRAAATTSFDLVLTDVRLPGLSGIDLFRKFRAAQPGVPVLLMTAYADSDDAVTVMREGAQDYIAKPFEMDELLARLARVRQAIEFHKHMESGARAPDGLRQPTFTGSSPAVRRLLERMNAAAAVDLGVLINGETGSGKDLCARIIHGRGRRVGKPFLAVNCAAIPENLLEAELFGHEKGAFTGADRRRVGRFEAANGGTLFLDEVGELSLASQVKLLRAIETNTFEPLGASLSITTDVRVIAATNKNLLGSIETGAFRRDLFYRLNVIDIDIPPLRERRADIPPLVGELLTEISARLRRPVPALDPAAVVALATHDYPGNVRELIHALERAVATATEGFIGLEHLPRELSVSPELERMRAACVPTAGDLAPLAVAVAEFEKQYVHRVLEKTGGHRGRAAAVLGISRKSLWERLRDARS